MDRVNGWSIAKQASVKSYDFDWIDDFSKARNYSIDKATGDYILILDGDEYLEDGSEAKIRKAMESGVDIMTLIQWNYIDGGNHIKCQHYRLFKNLPDIRYINRSHEVLIDKGHTTGLTDIIIYHTGYDFKTEEDKQAKSERNIKLHLQQLIDEPDNKDVRYNLTRAYGNFQRWERVIEYGTVALFLDGLDNDKRALLSYTLFLAWNNLERGDTALMYLKHSLELVPNQRRARLALANCLFQKEQFDETIKQLEMMKDVESGLTADLEHTNEFIDNELIYKVKQIKEQLCHTM
jgi:glycosyltransferase involved in cell wall biosynthesis